jgi:hypothetical protein
MGWFWGTVGAILALILCGMYLIDRRDRRRGHTPRDSADMWSDVRETRRDAKAIDEAGPIAGSGRVGWMAYFRENEGHEGRNDDPAP